MHERDHPAPRTRRRPASPFPGGEDRLTNLLARRFGGGAAGLRQGIGDDAAVVAPSGARELWIVTTDVLLEEVDFRRGWTTAEALGHKALAASLSDAAAMGAAPRFYTVALGLPGDLPGGWVLRFYRGMTALGSRHGALLVGGDLSRSPLGIHVSIALLGETAGRRWVARAGGRPGDLLYVTGLVGASAAGLRLLASGAGKRGGVAARRALDAHRRPEPRCEVGLWLAARGRAQAMLDLSDGLSADLPRLCRASGTGAEVDAWRLPLFEPARSWGFDPLELGLHGGEDFELLFAVRPEAAAALERAYPGRFPPLSRIGRLTPGRGIRSIAAPGARARPLPQLGFDHFRRAAGVRRRRA